MLRRVVAPLCAGVIVALGCTDRITAPDALSLSSADGEQQYVIIGNAERLPMDLEAQVRAAGGQLVGAHGEIGVAYARSNSGAFGARLSRGQGIESVVPDLVVQWVDPPNVRGEALEAEAPEVSEEVASIGDLNALYFLQWAPPAIQAPEAWNAGYRGAGVRVAILDGAIYANHADLAGGVDVARSASFVPGFAFNQDVGTFWHGTHVAGIVGARANNIGVIGIAPEATLIGVKVLHSGSGAFSWVINGILYAATPIDQGGAGAHVINMSLGATLDEKLKVDGNKEAVRELRKAIDRATRYAYQQGVTIIASAGNGATNFDLARELYKSPAQNEHVISVSATGPVGWQYRGASNFEQPAYYTDHGKSLVTLGAPGGSAGLFVVEGVDAICALQGIVNFCEAFDMVLSTSRGTTAAGGYSWAQGTSMAAPAVAGVAALIIGKNGGSMHPSQVLAALRQSAIDLDKPGNDEWYGHGWVNAWNAVR